MRILLTNDDGIRAPGMAVLEAIAREIGDEVWVVAPETDQSGIGHALTLSHPLRIREEGERRLAVNGTPADCVIAGVRTIMPEPPDLVLSGVNLGQNVADDVVYSGTIGGAMEASMMGLRSIALSQAYRRDEATGERRVDWSAASEHAPGLLTAAMKAELPDGVFLNLNFPAVPSSEVGGVSITRQGSVEHGLTLEERSDGRGQPYHWLRFARGSVQMALGSDVAALREGRISITPLHVDMTAHAARDGLKTALSDLLSERSGP